MTASHDARLGNETELTMTRVFDAPRQLVFKAWTDPEQLAQWWGPHGFTNPVCEVDLRPGGTWRIDMRGPDGTIYPNKGRYLEVVVPERIVYTDVVDDDATAWGDTPPPSTVQTVTFENADGGTKVTVVVHLDSIEARDAMVEMGAVTGWTESMERLEALLAAGRHGTGEPGSGMMRERPMEDIVGKVVSSTFVTRDGIVEAPDRWSFALD